MSEGEIPTELERDLVRDVWELQTKFNRSVDGLLAEREHFKQQSDRLHRILNHIADHGVNGERMTLIRKWGMSAVDLKPEDRVNVLIQEVENEMNRSKPQNK